MTGQEISRVTTSWGKEGRVGVDRVTWRGSSEHAHRASAPPAWKLVALQSAAATDRHNTTSHLDGGVVIASPHDGHNEVERGQRQAHPRGAGKEEYGPQPEHALPAHRPYAKQECQPEAYELGRVEGTGVLGPGLDMNCNHLPSHL